MRTARFKNVASAITSWMGIKEKIGFRVSAADSAETRTNWTFNFVDGTHRSYYYPSGCMFRRGWAGIMILRLRLGVWLRTSAQYNKLMLTRPWNDSMGHGLLSEPGSDFQLAAGSAPRFIILTLTLRILWTYSSKRNSMNILIQFINRNQLLCLFCSNTVSENIYQLYQSKPTSLPILIDVSGSSDRKYFLDLFLDSGAL